VSANGEWIDGLAPSLQRLDEMLESALLATRARRTAASQVLSPGVYHADDGVEGPLERESWASMPGADDARGPERGSSLAWLSEAFQLSAFDADVMLLALAPELDGRYGALLAALDDGATRPTVGLALEILAPGPRERVLARSRFGPGAPLVASALVHLVPPATQPATMLRHELVPDDQVVAMLLGASRPDRRLSGVCELIVPSTSLADLVLRGEPLCHLPDVVVRAGRNASSLNLHLMGPPGTGKRLVAEALAAELGKTLLSVDVHLAVARGDDAASVVALALREAWFRSAVPYLRGIDSLIDEPHGVELDRLMRALGHDAGLVILGGNLALPPSPHALDDRWRPTLRVPMARLGARDRRRAWRIALAARGIALEEPDLATISRRFRLRVDQVVGASVDAAGELLRRAALGRAADPEETADVIAGAARAESRLEFGRLASRVDPRSGWDDLVVPPDVRAHLEEMARAISHREHVMEAWGFADRLSRGRGVNALFAGPPGTGKTMAAEVLAGELGLDLFAIDLSAIVSKYIGDTEKNLDRLFEEARAGDAILLFDEADALFGRRSEVRDAHDRYANIEVSHLLQLMEAHEGVAILATNLRENLDDAFARRLAFTIEFPFPDEDARRRIWERVWPSRIPLATDVDPHVLGRRLRLSGGSIRNVALAAAYLAAAEGTAVSMEHILHGARREDQKLGRPIDLGRRAA
jgi:AAA+ superfamily predicted ATPase